MLLVLFGRLISILTLISYRVIGICEMLAQLSPIEYIIAMRFLPVYCLILVAVFPGGCQSTDHHSDTPDTSDTTEAASSDGCAKATQAYQDALNEAIEQAPSCQTDSDCVLFFADISTSNCPYFSISSCGSVVHREAAAKFESSEVQNRICKAAGSGPNGCSIESICAVGPTTPSCEAGECVAQ